jgi:hypothetical protein
MREGGEGCAPGQSDDELLAGVVRSVYALMVTVHQRQ